MRPATRPLAAALLAVGLLGPTARAVASDLPVDLSEVLRPIREGADLPAMGGAVIVGDRVVGLGVDGFRRRGRPERVTDRDRWHLGSCTKAMTATLVAQLVEEGLLAWDRRVGPSFPAATTPEGTTRKHHPGWDEVTLEQLLQHRGGAPANLDSDGLWARLWQAKGMPHLQRAMLVQGVLAQAPVAPAGSKFLYSNAGYAIAGAMVDSVAPAAKTSGGASAADWEGLIDARLFEPLSMSSAGFGPPGSDGALTEPLGHRADGTAVEWGPGADNPTAIAPAGKVHASLADWARFAILHLNGEKKGGLGISPASFRRMHTPPKGGDSDYALGWIVTRRDWGGRVLTHAGSNTMWFCVAWLSPERGFGVLVTCNQGGDKAAKACDDAAGALIRWHLDRKPR